MRLQTIVLVSQILLGLLTIVGSGVVSAAVTYKLTAQKARQDLLRQKLEELFSSVQNFGSLFVLAMVSHQRALSGRSSLEQAQKELEQSQPDTQALRRCEMLIALYFPDLGPTYSNWDQRQQEVVGLLKSSDADRFFETLQRFNQEQRNIEAALSKKALALLKLEPLIRLPWTKRQSG